MNYMRQFNPDYFHLPADENLGFVRIPADPGFRIGTRKADAKRIEKIIGCEVPNNEINDTITPTPEFYIARYPVTAAQFMAFICAKNPRRAKHITTSINRPVCPVNWYEAMAYCDWLNEILATAPIFAQNAVARLRRESGWRVTLPSELEWEKAARGGVAHAVFSWGDTPDGSRANYNESALGDTSTVGCFPANGFGLYDMIGNVWEWTRSLWGTDWENPDFTYPYNADDAKREASNAGDEVFRILRGGSWYDDRDYARCGYRLRLQPDDDNYPQGFRVIISCP